MNGIDQDLLNRRFELRKSCYLKERFKKSPNMNVHSAMTDHLHVSCAAQDVAAVDLIYEAFNRAYGYVENWFGCDFDMVFDLWMAPEMVDLQYMTCLPCAETFFCAPGMQSGMHVILFVSPQSCRQNANTDRLAGLLAHEITHHVIRNISQSSMLTMKRKENLDVPMWLEEGLCQFIESEVYPVARYKHTEEITRILNRYDRETLWNDLSACGDPETAYRQAYKITKTILETTGKTEVIRLLCLNRMHEVDWRSALQG